MTLEAMSFFRIASQRMQWLGTRQQVVSENIANADTPGYRARDVSPFESMVTRSDAGSGPAVSNPAHITGSGRGAAVDVREDEGTWNVSLDGNTVVLEEQSIKASEISENYRLAAQLYRKGYELLGLAASSK
ncbi:flagellar basal body rod protein [Oceanicola granulosus HTCC2516]|uniref:Flagellar basal body rod protein FlgB n=1 Tax=Oceanicola granulosus (strain ATCC BAA-861 / DSM 15982 / KCTC 12143 / HTCC2516) TaxID=314256 RepID=Q2CGJ2_OCEGH|nr:flagellar basal body protein [Oceanicola granulosus]EAR51726.1 flagellar basal body rod protein [Oceanicola granulosus HTCC2516]